MKVSYYPGCSLHGTGLEYAESAEAVLSNLGTELVELEDWSCCGASSAHSSGKELAVSMAARNLMLAKESGLKDLVIPCAACYQRTRIAEIHLLDEPEKFADFPYTGEVAVTDLLTYVSENIGIESIRKNVKKKLTGLKAVCYYGCVSIRHPKVTRVKDYENPNAMETILNELGVEALPWSYQTDCCGGSLVLSRTDIVHTLSGKLFEKALEAGAECIVTGCPLCQGNLDQRQGEIEKKLKKKYDLPIFYFTELMGIAMGHDGASGWLKRHFVDPVKLLKEKGIL